MPDDIRTKGTNILAMIAAVESLRGAALRDAIVADLPGSGGEEIRTKAVIAAGWYPIGWYRDLLGAIVAHTEAPLVRQLGRASTRANVSTIHRIFMRMISPHTLIKQGGRLFSSYFEGASVTIENVEGQTERIVWKDCHGFDRNCWQDQIGSTEELVTMSGAQVVRSKVLSGGHDRDSQMVLELVWK